MVISDRRQMGKCWQGSESSSMEGCVKCSGRIGQGQRLGTVPPEVARRAAMEETRSKRNCLGSPNTVLDSARERHDNRHDG
jgi:hypothetical protein